MSPLVTLIETDAEKMMASIAPQSFEGKHVLITGASGLIGTYLLAGLRTLRKKGINVEVTAVTQSPFPTYLSAFTENVKCYAGDITDNTFLESLPHADYIIHAAGYGQPGKFMEDQLKTIALNTTSTIALLGKLNPNGKFLFMSTSEVYSGLPNPPYREDQIGITNTDHPRSCYIEGKRCGEAIVQAARQKGIDARSARLSLAYGPGTKKNDARVINSFIYRGIVEKKITLMDQGEAKRTYCYVTDAVEMMLHILLSGTDPIYNIGGFSKTTIGELAKSIGVYLDVPTEFPPLESAPLQGAPDDVSLEMTKTKNLSDKKEFVSFEEGLRNTIEWQKALYALK